MKKYLKIMFLLFLEIFLFLSCNSKEYNGKVIINWIDLYGIETIDFDKSSIILSYDIPDENNQNKRNILELNPKIDNFVILEKNVRNFSIRCINGDIGCYVYPNIQLPDKKRKIEIYLFKDILPDDDNKLIFMKHEQVLGYSYFFNKDDYIYAVLSKNNVMDLNLNNVRKLTDINTIVNPPEYNIMNLDENEIVYFSFKEEPRIPEKYPYCAYYVKNKIDNKIIQLNNVFFVIDKDFKMSTLDFK